MIDISKERGYRIENYNPEWVTKFNSIKSELNKIWKDASKIEHVGSTSIPGMKAKPIIDILIVFKEWTDFQNEVQQMHDLGYEAQENAWSDHSWLFYKIKQTERGIEKTENIHLLIEGEPKIPQFLEIRDFLRTHPDKAKAYSELKENLVNKFPDDYFAYRSGKQSLLQEIEKETAKWSKSKA